MNKSGTAEFDVFWGEMSPCEHLVQIYEDDTVLLDALDGFVGGGLRNGEAAIVIATPAHCDGLGARLRRQGLDLDAMASEGRYLALDAEETLSLFMRNGWPNADLFREVIQDVLLRAKQDGRRVRAFGEMVALLWAQGHSGATVQLEHLWHALCRAETFSLFCAYPHSGWTRDAGESMQEICDVHSRVIGRPQ